jgi:O-methyltransferase involved in polyketide biosynthesis
LHRIDVSLDQESKLMTNKLSTQQLTGVSETLLITLYARAIETQRSDAIVRDQKAVEILQKLDYDFSKFDKAWKSRLGTILRTYQIDQLVRQFIGIHPNAVIVNLGCGLCTRFFRVDNGTIQWYEVDFDEVVELRKKLLSSGERYHFIKSSIFDFGWINQVQQLTNQPLLIILEGVTIYLTESENKLLLQNLQSRLAPVEIICDVMSRLQANNTKFHDSVSKTNITFKWGIDNVKDLETWNFGISDIHEYFYNRQIFNYPHRLPGWFSLILKLFPSLQNANRVIQMRINPS